LFSTNKVVSGVNMKSGGRWALGASIVGFGVLTMLASIMFGTTSLAGIGLASFLIGLLTLYLPSQPSVAPELVTAYARSSLENVERFLRELGPESKATYLRLNDRSDVPKVFLPVTDNPTADQPDLKDYDQLLIVNPEDPHRTGLLLDAPGASLLALIEKESGVDFFDVERESVLDALKRGLVESVELVADVKGSTSDNPMKLRICDGPVELSKSIERSAPKTLARLGCPVCSAAICAIVKATKRPVAVENVSHEAKYHDLTLTFLGGE
jgi:hypothetical protein